MEPESEIYSPPPTPTPTPTKKFRNILITREERDEFGEMRLRIDQDTLHRLLINENIGNKPVAIISIIGVKRTGKSFLLNFILRYFREKGWENPHWMGLDDTKADKDDIAYKKSKDRCTTGIRIYEEKFEVPIDSDGNTMIVMIMDTQGLFDFETPEQVNKTVLTLSTMLSSVQIFNVMKHIDAQHMQYLELQRLMFLIRDYPEDDDLDEPENTFSLGYGKDILDDILLSKKGGAKQLDIRKKIRTIFEDAGCFPLPNPGKKAERKHFEGKNKELENDFRQAVKSFVEEIACPDKLVPKRSEKKFLTPREILYTIAGCDNLFAMKMFEASAMIEKNVEGFYASECEEAVLEYAKVLEHRFEESFTDELRMKKAEIESREHALRRYDSSSSLGSPSIRRKYRDDLVVKLEDHYQNFLDRCKCREKLIKSKKDKEIKNALLEYRRLMEIKISETISMTPVEEIHNDVLKDVIKICGVDVDHKIVKDKASEVFQTSKSEYEKRMKDSVNAKKNERNKKFFLLIHVKLRNKCEEMWKEKLIEYPSDDDIEAHKMAIEGTITREFWSKALSPAEYQHVRLLYTRLDRVKEIVRHEAGWGELLEENKTESQPVDEIADYSKIVEDVTADFAKSLRLESSKFSDLSVEYEDVERELTEGHERKYFELCNKYLNPAADNLEKMLENEYAKAKDIHETLWIRFKEDVSTLVNAIVLDHEKYLQEQMGDKHIKSGEFEKYYEQAIEDAKNSPPEEIGPDLIISERTKKYYGAILTERMSKSCEKVEKKNEERKELRPIQECENPNPTTLKRILNWFRFPKKNAW